LPLPTRRQPLIGLAVIAHAVREDRHQHPHLGDARGPDAVEPAAHGLARLEKLNRLHFRASRAENLIPVTPEIARELKQIWTVRGFWSGPVDGTVDRAFQKTLVDFMGWENYDTRIQPVEKVDLTKGGPLVIDREVLEDIRAVFAEKRWKPREP
jgi:hypothetical protein